MKKRIREEFLEFYRDRWTLVINAPTISVPTVLLILSNVQGKPYLLPLIVYIIIIYGIFSNSAYMWLAWIKTASIGVSSTKLKETFAPKYPSLRPFGITGVILSLLLIPFFSFVPPFKGPVDIYFRGTPTLTPTQTYTVTPSSTVTLTPTPIPISDSLYYMIVYDSSENMNESFHGEEKWQVARNMLVAIFNGLNPRAKYSFVAIGGSNLSDNISNTCDNPASLTLPFTSRQSAYDFLGTLQPQGGGSFYKAYTLAKIELEDLPKETIPTLIYITGSADACETENEWTSLKNLVSIPDSAFGIFSQIIILDDDGIRSQTLAEQFNSLSNDKINAQAPQSVSEIQSGGVTTSRILNNMTDYVNDAIEARATDTPFQTVPVNTPPTFASFTPLIPTITALVSPVPTFTPLIVPTKTLTPIPQPTNTSAPSVVLLSATYIDNGQLHGCDADILFNVVGSSVTGNFHVWNANYSPEGDIYPPQTFPVENNQHRVVGLGGHGNPSFYPHEVWFVYNGNESNRLTGLICPRYLTPTP